MHFVSRLLLTAGLLCSTATYAHAPENIGAREKDPLMPVVPEAFSKPAIADRETQLMALDMRNTSCSDLLALDDELKYAFLVTHIFMQSEGALSKIVDPECQYLGSVEKIATIEDDALTTSGKRETLYFIPDMDALIVSNREDDSLAYGLFMETEEDPLEYFLENRVTAAKEAFIAQKFAKEVMMATRVAPKSRIQNRSSSSISSVTFIVDASSRSSLPSTAPPSPDVVYEEALPQDLPSIQPLGPLEQPEIERESRGYWILMIILTIVMIAVAILVLRSRATAKKGYMDE